MRAYPRMYIESTQSYCDVTFGVCWISSLVGCGVEFSGTGACAVLLAHMG